MVAAYAKEHDIDLVCMGARGSDFSVGKPFVFKRGPRQ
jgi:nucleotide-binding universal stress UspA family protein